MKLIRICFIAAVLLLCLIPSALMLGGYKNANRENRPLAKLPKLITDKGVNREFFNELDSYTNDHFALREYMVTALNTVSGALVSDNIGTNALIGKSGHLFFGKTVNDYTGVSQLSGDEIDSIAEYLADIAKKFESDGGMFAFMIAPNKATIYGEYMPDYLCIEDTPRNIDMLTEALKARGVRVIDAKRILLENKDAGELYYKHDSHWNDLGAMLVYNEIAECFSLERFDAYDYKIVNDHTGDLHNFVYPATECDEERVVYPELYKYRSKRPIDFKKDKKVETFSDLNDIEMIVLHDSFARSLQPFLSQTVGRLNMSSYFPYNLDYVKQLKPNILLIELVERNLDELCEYARSLGY